MITEQSQVSTETDSVNISLSMSSNGVSLTRCETNHQWKFGDERHTIAQQSGDK